MKVCILVRSDDFEAIQKAHTWIEERMKVSSIHGHFFFSAWPHNEEQAEELKVWLGNEKYNWEEIPYYLA